MLEGVGTEERRRRQGVCECYRLNNVGWVDGAGGPRRRHTVEEDTVDATV
jgi:hypothetical protein